MMNGVIGKFNPLYLRGREIPFSPAWLMTSIFCCVPAAYFTCPSTTCGPSASTDSAFTATTSPQISPTISNTLS